MPRGGPAMSENIQNKNTCAGPECDRKVRAYGLCPSHYQQKRRQGPDGLIPIGSYVRRAKGCDFPKCGRKHHAKGLCWQHYKAQGAGRELKPIKADQVNDNETGE